jgi:hypothetical protein
MEPIGSLLYSQDPLNLRPFAIFLNEITFCGEEFLASCPNPKM